MCLGLCKEKNVSNILGFRSGKEDIFGISNLGRCSKHLEAIHKCKEMSAGNFISVSPFQFLFSTNVNNIVIPYLKASESTIIFLSTNIG